jgi:predicted amidohydrolase
MRVAFANIYTENSDMNYNFERIKTFCDEALKKSVELLIFPRLAINGVGVAAEDLENKNYIDNYYKILDNVVDLTCGKMPAILLGGVFIKEDKNYKEEIYDAAFFIQKNSI